MIKYVIEFDKEQLLEYDKDTDTYFRTLYKAKGFNALVFDKHGLDKLTPLDKELDEAYTRGLEEGKKQAKVQAHLDVCHDIDRVARGNYQKGLDDAWECAKKISLMSPDEIEKVFPGAAKYNRYNLGYSGVEAIERLKAYEQQKADEIKASDIITDGKINYLVIDITDKSYVALQGTDFEPVYIGKDYIKSYHNLHDSKDMRKIAEEISKAIKGEKRDCYTCKHQVASSIECVDCRGFGKWEPKGDAE